jgi:hypothetical protein
MGKKTKITKSSERERLFKIFDTIKEKLPDIPPEEADEDICKAIQAIRRENKEQTKRKQSNSQINEK